MTDKSTARLQRGQTTGEYDLQFTSLPDRELMALLNDPEARLRTSVARLLGDRKSLEAIPLLCACLQIEKMLYPRIAISEALGAIGEPALHDLVELLGKVAINQHHSLPGRGFYKKSYPLPRDIVTRTIIKIGRPAIMYLEKVVLQGDRGSLLEALDGIGYIAFYSKDISLEPVLLTAYQAYQSDPVVRWKIVRAFLSFPTERVRQVLLEIIRYDDFPELRWEAVRSLGQQGLPVSLEVILLAQTDPHAEVRKMAQMFLNC